jgi:predicted RNase H-like nuclease
MQLAGIDLAWRSSKNPTALAVGWLAGRELDLEDVAKHLYGIGSILDHL